MFKIWSLSRTVVCVRVCVVGGQDVITIQTSTMMTPQSATVSRVSTACGVGGLGSDYKCILLSQRVSWYMHALNIDGNEHRRYIKMSQKSKKKNTPKK